MTEKIENKEETIEKLIETKNKTNNPVLKAHIQKRIDALKNNKTVLK